MPKIRRASPVYILAFFILYAFFLCQDALAQDVKTLKNGLRVIIEEDHRNPIVVFSVFIQTGAAYEGKYTGSGISHLIEHMLFKGSSKYPPGSIENILHKYGGEIAGFTSHDYTSFRITILNKHTDVALDILKEMLTSSEFDPEEIKKEKQVIIREMELNEDDPERRIARLTFSTAYVRHPYRIPVIGYRENFERLHKKDLLEFFKSNYTPEKIVLAVVGDINTKGIFNDIKNIFGAMHRGDNIIPALPQEPPQITKRIIEEKHDMKGAYLNIAFHSTGLLHKDIYALDILSFILGQGESSVLNKKLRIKDKIVLSVSAYNYTPREPGLFIISCRLKEEYVKEALNRILHEVDIIKKEGVTEKELARAKNNFLADYIYQKETLESRANDLAYGELLTGNPKFSDLYIEHIDKVKPEDVQQVAREYLTEENMTVAVLSESGEALKQNINLLLQTNTRKRKVKKIILKNKLRLLIAKDPSLPIVSAVLLFKGGVRMETEENNGISRLVSRMFMDGTGTMTREQIANLYESKGMSINTYSGNNSFGITLKCLKKDTEQALRLISDLCLNSTFPEAEMKREKKETLADIEMQDNQLFNYGHRLLKELLFKQHPYRFQTIGTSRSVANIRREDTQRFYRNLLSSKNAVLGVAGDCDVSRIKKLAEMYFSNMPSGEPGYHLPQKEPMARAARQRIVRTEREQSLLLIGFHGIDIFNKDRYAIEIMVDIFSRESGILFKSIREKNALSYATGAFQVLGLDPGYIVIYVFTPRENILRAKKIITREINNFIKNGVTEEELERSKNHLKAVQQMKLQTDENLIFTTCIDELYGLGYNNYEYYNKNIEKVTAKDIKNVASKYLSMKDSAILILEGRK